MSPKRSAGDATVCVVPAQWLNQLIQISEALSSMAMTRSFCAAPWAPKQEPQRWPLATRARRRLTLVVATGSYIGEGFYCL